MAQGRGGNSESIVDTFYPRPWLITLTTHSALQFAHSPQKDTPRHIILHIPQLVIIDSIHCKKQPI